jgi:photosystem II stability/assembly factor-like uncharacterized protein
MSSVLLTGTAVTRPGAVGTLFRCESGGPWQPAAGMPLDTGVQALTPHPTRPGTVFAATRGGLYRSTDAGASWTKLDVPAGKEEFWSVSVHPRDPGVVFAGVAPVGVYRSDDGGDHWRRVGPAEPMPEICDYTNARGLTSRLMRLGFDPTDPQLMFGACETNGLLVSGDGGETWRDASGSLIGLANHRPELKSTAITPNDVEGILDGHAVCITPLRPGVVFYACRMGLFTSANQGRTWHDHGIPRFAPYSYCRDLRIAVDSPGTFYLALSIGPRSNTGALYRSTDVGETWNRVDEGMNARSTIMSMNVHATDPGKVIYLTRGGQVMWTEDGCASWNERQLPTEAGDAYCAAIL